LVSALIRRAYALFWRLVNMLRRPFSSYGRADFRNFLNFLSLSMKDRYLGSRLGLAWAIVGPLLMLSIFTFVFAFVFKSKLPGAETSISYVIWLIAGYGPWLFISEGLSSSTSAFVKHAALIRNISFKRELLVFAEALTGIVPLLVAVVFLAGLLIMDGRAPSFAWIIIPPILLAQYILVCGFGLILGSINVFARDVMFALPNILTVVLFASPIFYPLSAFPPGAQRVMQYNPIYVILESYRAPILNGTFPSLWTIAYSFGSALVIFAIGAIFYARLRPYFDSRL
jgi:lipopolysaccharide transport system permease protein